METRKKPGLSMQQRLDVLQDLARSQPVSTVAAKYHVHPITIRRIKKNVTSISEFAEKDNIQKKRRRLRKPLYEELENHLYAWYKERKIHGDSVNEALMLKKATELKETIPSCSDFKVSQSWLAKFKRRRGIRLLHVYGENITEEEEAAKAFVENFQKFVEEEGINEENIYNMTESRLMWKALPIKTLAELNEKCASDYKISKERITIGLCANALGTSKIMPLVIYKYRNPMPQKHCVNRLSVVSQSHTNTWMDESLFLNWFENHFKPNVRAYQVQKQISGKVILLLGDSDGHNISTNIQEDNDFKIMYLPPNTNILIQPMDQGIIEKTKTLFRHKILQKVLKYNGGVNQFYNDFTINDCIDILHKSWTEISSKSIRNAWKTILKMPATYIERNEGKDLLQCDIQDLMSTINGEKSTEEQITEFLTACEEAENTSFITEEEFEEEENEGKGDHEESAAGHDIEFVSVSAEGERTSFIKEEEMIKEECEEKENNENSTAEHNIEFVSVPDEVERTSFIKEEEMIKEECEEKENNENSTAEHNIEFVSVSAETERTSFIKEEEMIKEECEGSENNQRSTAEHDIEFVSVSAENERTSFIKEEKMIKELYEGEENNETSTVGHNIEFLSASVEAERTSFIKKEVLLEDDCEGKDNIETSIVQHNLEFISVSEGAVGTSLIKEEIILEDDCGGKENTEKLNLQQNMEFASAPKEAQRSTSMKKKVIPEKKYGEKRNSVKNQKKEVEKQKTVIKPHEWSEQDKKELKHLFERLTFYSASSPRYVQLMVESLKLYFLGSHD